ncbi:LysR family transcriptional regulator [Caenibius tardaugens]|uniref:LysR family transcriptional regulator n=1 Tax=Caenibius tardaugens TaxID=169176 RepID=UPI000A07BC96|nr:LysR family transcriptional regulator [Caenibius tardaugens]AZI35203.1 LysR family transcriptional regulator [Caenibius tardaugens NBRC 16725]
MDLRTLRHFVTLANRSSFVAAAQELNLTQPALSRSIKGLEGELGTQLVLRHRNGCSLTPAGEVLLQGAAAILRRSAALQHNMRAFGRGEMGHLRFGAAPLPAALFVPRLMSKIVHAQSGVTIRVALGSINSLLDQLRQDKIEFFICAETRLPRDPDLSLTKLFDVPVSCIVRKQHPLARKLQVSIGDMKNYPFACVVSDFTQGSDITPNTTLGLPVTIECDDYFILHSVIRDCDAVCLSSSALLDAQTDLLTLPVIGIPHSNALVLVRHHGRQLSPLANAALAQIQTINGSNPLEA